MKRAFLVLGCQGSGTRMLTAAFIEAGCRGSAEHQQPMDDLDFRFADLNPIVFRRSLPHGGQWPNLREIVGLMQVEGYSVIPVFTYRKTDYLVAHQLRCDREYQGAVVDAYAETDQQVKGDWDRALTEAYTAAEQAGQPLLVVPYEPFAMIEAVRAAFFKTLDLPVPQMDFLNGNEHERYSEVEALPW